MASQKRGKGRNRGTAAARHEKNAKLWPQRGWERAHDSRKKPSTSLGIPNHFLAPRKALSPFTIWQKAVLPKGWSAGGPSVETQMFLVRQSTKVGKPNKPSIAQVKHSSTCPSHLQTTRRTFFLLVSPLYPHRHSLGRSVGDAGASAKPQGAEGNSEGGKNWGLVFPLVGFHLGRSLQSPRGGRNRLHRLTARRGLALAPRDAKLRCGTPPCLCWSPTARGATGLRAVADLQVLCQVFKQAISCPITQ